MSSPAASENRPGTKRLILLGLVVVLAGSAAWATFAWQSHRAKGVDSPAPKALSHYPRLPIEESGTLLVHEHFFVPHIKDPTSLEDIRDAYRGAGLRCIEFIKQQLTPAVPADKRMPRLINLARAYFWEGEFQRAAEALTQARQLADSDPDQFEQIRPTILFLQGVAALRRGETENCVACQCRTSCILPIQPEAVHQKREGSREAIGFFTEYLQTNPDDIGAQWLLNVASMTLGEYPEAVPAAFRLPSSAFQSEVDIGRFLDIAAPLGVNRLNEAGGAIMDDFDNDGLLDLVVTSGEHTQPMAFYRNRGDGTFEDRTQAAGLDKQLGGFYCVQTDYNNDGYLDIYVCRGAWLQKPLRHTLLRNNGNGTFTDVTAQAGLLAPVDSQVAVWADYDNDGFLDLFVGGESVPSRLYHNRGDGTFEEVSARAGVANAGFICKGANWGDFDGDGYPDLYVSNSNGPPRLFHNNRDGTFTDVAPQLGITQPVKGFSCWFWDYDNDGWLDIFASAYEVNLNRNVEDFLGRPNQGQKCRLYRNLQGKGFADVTEAVGLDRAVSPMGSNFLDVDNDGFLDLYLATGGPNYSLLVPNRLFKNVDGKRFVDITMSSGTGHLQKGHAVACGDWDRDGNVDMFVQIGGFVPGDRFRNALFQNPGHDNHWITVKLVGKKTNRAAIGARIKLALPGDPRRSIYRHVTSGSSFGGNTLQQTIGVGKATSISSLEIYWPTTKTTQVFRDVSTDQAIEITEFATTYRRLNWKRIPQPQG
jgi:tetratricopeptide (TPR) repeat protein